MKNSKIKLSQEVQSHILNGGQIVLNETMGKNTTLLIRMPEGEYIADDRVKMYRNNSFEYVLCQDFLDDNVVRVAGYRNDTLRGAKKDADKEHQEITWLKQ